MVASAIAQKITVADTTKTLLDILVGLVLLEHNTARTNIVSIIEATQIRAVIKKSIINLSKRTIRFQGQSFWQDQTSQKMSRQIHNRCHMGQSIL